MKMWKKIIIVCMTIIILYLAFIAYCYDPINFSSRQEIEDTFISSVTPDYDTEKLNEMKSGFDLNTSEGRVACAKSIFENCGIIGDVLENLNEATIEDVLSAEEIQYRMQSRGSSRYGSKFVSMICRNGDIYSFYCFSLVGKPIFRYRDSIYIRPVDFFQASTETPYRLINRSTFGIMCYEVNGEKKVEQYDDKAGNECQYQYYILNLPNKGENISILMGYRILIGVTTFKTMANYVHAYSPLEYKKIDWPYVYNPALS